MTGFVRWSEIPDFPNYAISDEGEVVNVRHGRTLSPVLEPNGTLRVMLYRDGERHKMLLHHLVAAAYIPGWAPRRHIEFIDGDPTNCHVMNLQLKFPGDELNRYIPVHVRGQRVMIVETGDTFKNAYTCARHLGTNASNIYSVLRGRRKSHLGYTFRYVDAEIEPWNDDIS